MILLHYPDMPGTVIGYGAGLGMFSGPCAIDICGGNQTRLAMHHAVGEPEYTHCRDKVATPLHMCFTRIAEHIADSFHDLF